MNKNSIRIESSEENFPIGEFLKFEIFEGANELRGKFF